MSKLPLAPRASRLVAGLSRGERLVAMLLYAERLTVVEAAAVLGVEPREVRRLDGQLRRKLLDRLGPPPK